MNADKHIRAVLNDGTLEAEAVTRLADKYRLTEHGWQKRVKPTLWVLVGAKNADAVLQMAVRVALADIRKELEARPGITWEESGWVTEATNDQRRVIDIVGMLPGLLRSES